MKAVNKNFRHGYQTHHEAIWASIRVVKEFNCKELWAVINKTAAEGTVKDAKELSQQSIRCYLVGLTIAGYLEQTVTKELSKNNKTGTSRWKLIKDVGIDAPRISNKGEPIITGQIFDNMWKAMKILGSFNWKELQAHASLTVVPIKDIEAQRYICDLYNAGYLVRTEKIRGSSARYKLLPPKYTGPRPPVRQRVIQVFDPNLGEVVWSTGEIQ